jgi:hypothetical protein
LGHCLLAVALLIFSASASQAGETRCWIDRGAIVVPAAFGDIAGDFILDLARPQTALHDTRANADGLIGGTASAPLSLAGENLGTKTLPILNLDPETRSFDTTVNGVLGADIFSHRVLTLDLRKGRCRLSLSRHGPRGQRDDIVVSTSTSRGLPAVEARATDGLKVRLGLYALGTSRAETLVTRARPSRPESPGIPLRLRAFEVGGRLNEQVPAEIPAAHMSGLAGAIGTTVLKGARLIINLRGTRPPPVPTMLQDVP